MGKRINLWTILNIKRKTRLDKARLRFHNAGGWPDHVIKDHLSFLKSRIKVERLFIIDSEKALMTSTAFKHLSNVDDKPLSVERTILPHL